MEFLINPEMWVGLLTLVVLEIVLGIDNLVFIAILADRLPKSQRDKARIVGLSLALLMRLGLLAAISWMVTLTTPLFHIGNFGFSGRGLILLCGGIFLLFKATMELHERLEGQLPSEDEKRNYAKFWAVVVQIIILDVVFSLDAVITAVGMVNNLPVMMAAVVIAMMLMLIASKPLTSFVNAHPTIVVLCLSFLLMIGLSLIAEGFGLHIPKGYLYAAIGFSIIIELFNQIARRNFLKNQARRPMRERTAEAIMRLIRQTKTPQQQEQDEMAEPLLAEQSAFAAEERYMINGVLTLSSRSLRSVMTPRADISWVNCEEPLEKIRTQLLDTPHSMFPVCRGELDEIVGVVRAKEMLVAVENGEDVVAFAKRTPPIVVPETIDVINLMAELRRAKGSLVMVTNEFGAVQGVVTPLDILEAIAGEFPDEDETPDIVVEGDSLLAKGRTDLHSLAQALENDMLISPKEKYASLAGFLLAHYEQVPVVGEVLELGALRFEILALEGYRIELVRITKLHDATPQEQEPSTD